MKHHDFEPQDGDPRRCPRHGVLTSDPNGLFDAPCGACEAETEARQYDDEPSAPREYSVERAFGADGPDGWDLLLGSEWCQRFTLKRDAVAAKRELEAEEHARAARRTAAKHTDGIIPF
jgi:hypothetical protein